MQTLYTVRSLQLRATFHTRMTLTCFARSSFDWFIWIFGRTFAFPFDRWLVLIRYIAEITWVLSYNSGTAATLVHTLLARHAVLVL